MVDFERMLPYEELDTANIVRGILKVQAMFAAQEKRPLGRGTHTKGICARASFEVFDIHRTIADPALAARLAQGIYAKPGVYPATVRFANAASTVLSDRKPDLRALSFSVNLTPDAPEPAYQDYSLQSNPTFPVNDAHAFAVLMGVLSQPTPKSQLKAIAGLSLTDLFRFAKAAVIGKLQTSGKTRAYQQMRYWSTVPFRNGPAEAIKYSAIPNPANPADELGKGPNDLRDELVRHLQHDEHMSSFDFGLQLLDTDRLTRWGFYRLASFWIENATVEWKESQAPFHVIGRLTLLPKSNLPVEECEPRHIDVTGHATPDTQPLGSVNRARWASEVASRKVRLGEETAESVLDALPTKPLGPRPRFAWVPNLALALLVFVPVLYFVAGFVYRHMAARTLPPPQHVDEVRYLDQGWGFDRDSADRQSFYYTPQGTSMHGIRYSWFVNLELPFQKKRLADPDNMRALNFVVDPAPSAANPDLLPVGFARRYDDTLQDNVVDITCAACHTGQLNITRNGVTTAVRIDGGEAMTAFTDIKAGSFQVDLLGGLVDTLANPFKFNRFAARVLGPNADTSGNRWQLWWNMTSVLGGLAKVGSSLPFHYPTQEGYGRTDALARISNVVFGDHISPGNYHVGNGPVSYPYLWNIWKFNWEQYGASVSQPMARNVGEALGVGASYQFVDNYGGQVPEADRYRTSVSFDNLLRIESTLQKLTPPQWPEDVFGPINQASAARGKEVFDRICARCHGPFLASDALKEATSPGRLPQDPMWVIRYKLARQIGTDPTTADNFYNNTVDLSKTGISFEEVRTLLKQEYETEKARDANLIPDLQKEIAAYKPTGPDDRTLVEYNQELADARNYALTDQGIAQQIDAIDLRSINAGQALNVIGLIIRNRYYTENHMSSQAQGCFAGFDTLDLPQVVDGYKPRPLQGVWATPPFLHNGSVPNLYELLSPYKERSTKFYVGYREFDPKLVGYATAPPKGYKGGFWFDTRLSGNHNTGHLFDSDAQKSDVPGVIGPTFSPQQRLDIIEYLKIRVDDSNLADRKPIDCFALVK